MNTCAKSCILCKVSLFFSLPLGNDCILLLHIILVVGRLVAFLWGFFTGTYTLRWAYRQAWHTHNSSGNMQERASWRNICYAWTTRFRENSQPISCVTENYGLLAAETPQCAFVRKKKDSCREKARSSGMKYRRQCANLCRASCEHWSIGRDWATDALRWADIV